MLSSADSKVVFLREAQTPGMSIREQSEVVGLLKAKPPPRAYGNTLLLVPVLRAEMFALAETGSIGSEIRRHSVSTFAATSKDFRRYQEFHPSCASDILGFAPRVVFTPGQAPRRP